MNELWKYLVESGLSLCLFYGIYWTFLRRDTFFARNRFYLALTIILSMIIPLLSISIRQPAPIYSIEVMIDEAVIIPASSSNVHSGFSVQNLLKWFYWAGAGFFLLKFLFHTGQIFWLIKRFGISKENGVRIVYLDRNISPFSFYNIIFLNRSLTGDKYREKIIAHEKNHIRNRHTLDLIIFEILTIVQWFNPVAWLYKWSLREVHEFQADEAVIREGHNSLNYQELIISQVFGNQFFMVAHNLNKSLIKKRIIMMTKFKSSKIARYKIILAIPVALLIIALFSFSGNQPEPENRITSPVSQDIPVIVMQDTLVYFKVDTMPKFQGGDGEAFRDYISENLRYPSEAMEKGISGKVYVQFLVNTEGKIKDVKVVRGVDPLLDKEAVRVISNSPAWKPGKQDGKTVTVAYTFPITFALDGTKEQPQESMKDSEVEGEVFFIVEEMPKFQGSDDFTKFRNYVADNLIYPGKAAQKKIEGQVFVQFVVDENGEVIDPKIIRGVDPLLDKEAIRVVNSSPKWEPGLQKGIMVPVQFTLPIVFKLSENPVKNAQDEVVEAGFKSKISDDALYLIDGKIVSHDIFSTLNPNHIESVEVIRGEKAGALYGKSGENGVISVKMKSGEDKPDGLAFRVIGLQSITDILFLIDGKKVTMEEVKILNTADIQSIEVLKGEKAEKEYGAAAKEGVVKITMK